MWDFMQIIQILKFKFFMFSGSGWAGATSLIKCHAMMLVQRRWHFPNALARACIVNETATPLMEVRPCPVPLDATGQRIISSQRLDKTMVLDGVEEEMLTPEP